MKLTSKLLKADLRSRWASIIEEDTQTEGFWDDVEKVLGFRPEPEGEHERAIMDWVDDFAQRLRQGADRRRRPGFSK